MSESIIRKRRRRRNAFLAVDNLTPSDLASPPESSDNLLDSNSDVPPSVEPPTAFPSFTAYNLDINSIRAELLEDTYHSEFAESDYSDDTHDWGGDNLHLSLDYCHFLGRYE